MDQWTSIHNDVVIDIVHSKRANDLRERKKSLRALLLLSGTVLVPPNDSGPRVESVDRDILSNHYFC